MIRLLVLKEDIVDVGYDLNYADEHGVYVICFALGGDKLICNSCSLHIAHYGYRYNRAFTKLIGYSYFHILPKELR